MMTFTSPRGTDPVKYAASILGDAINVNPARLERIGDKLVQEIRIRTADSESFDGASFVSYAPSTAKRKGFPEPDLRSDLPDDFGHMMDDLTVHVVADPPTIEIGIWEHGGKAAVAQIQNEGSHSLVASHKQGDKIINAYLRRRKIRGVTFKGGRMNHADIASYKKEEYIVKTEKSVRKIKTTFIKGSPMFRRTPHLINRVFVRRKRTGYWEKEEVLEKKTRLIKSTRRVNTYRTPTKAVIPARPFLGISESDRELVARYLTSPDQEGN